MLSQGEGVKLNGPKSEKWTVVYETERFKKLKVGGLKKWTVTKFKNGPTPSQSRQKIIKILDQEPFDSNGNDFKVQNKNRM